MTLSTSPSGHQRWDLRLYVHLFGARVAFRAWIPVGWHLSTIISGNARQACVLELVTDNH